MNPNSTPLSSVIPAIHGSVTPGTGSLSLTLPLTYEGSFEAAALFPLKTCGVPVVRFIDVSAAALTAGEGAASEGYHLTISPEGVIIEAAAEAGKYYAMTTLMQLIRSQGGLLPSTEIQDAPKYGYRGFMLDSARHFFPVEEVKKLIDQMGRLKMNIFHWHLSDDQGYRIESKRFPKLNTIGSSRIDMDGSTYAHYYTQEEIRDIVAYAADRYITVIPEVDLPGHTSSIIASFPELSCSGEAITIPWAGGIYEHICCAGKPEVYDFLYELLDEVVPLFPGPYFHLGGDEAPKGEWKKCPYCQAMIRRQGLQDEEALQAYFTRRLIDHLEKLGKKAICWNEALHSGTLPEGQGVAIQYWMESGEPYSLREVAKGYPLIFSNFSSFYLDYDPAMVSLKAGYLFEPNLKWNYDIPKDQILGLEAPVWTEFIATSDHLERNVFPRLIAMAENAWGAPVNDAGEKDFEEFTTRLSDYVKTQLPADIATTPVADCLLSGQEGIQRFFAAAQQMAGRAGAAQQKASLPPEVAEEMAKTLAGFLMDLTHYTFTTEEQGQILGLLQQALGR